MVRMTQMDDVGKGTKDRKITFTKNYTNENILKGEIMFANIFVLWSIQIEKSFN
jgi:hypothetical protein